MKDLRIRLIRNKEELEKVHKIREIVFIKGQDVPREIEIDKHEDVSKHIIVFYKEKPIGCARIRLLKDKSKLERIAVLEKYRKKGIGKEILRYMVRYSKRKGYNKIIMHAQCHALSFYEKSGFEICSKEFYEAEIKHVKMKYKHKK